MADPDLPVFKDVNLPGSLFDPFSMPTKPDDVTLEDTSTAAPAGKYFFLYIFIHFYNIL